MKEDRQSEKGSLRRTWHICKEGGSLLKSCAVGSVLGRESPPMQERVVYPVA